jgi:hypothetical protein
MSCLFCCFADARLAASKGTAGVFLVGSDAAKVACSAVWSFSGVAAFGGGLITSAVFAGCRLVSPFSGIVSFGGGLIKEVSELGLTEESREAEAMSTPARVRASSSDRFFSAALFLTRFRFFLCRP